MSRRKSSPARVPGPTECREPSGSGRSKRCWWLLASLIFGSTAGPATARPAGRRARCCQPSSPPRRFSRARAGPNPPLLQRRGHHGISVVHRSSRPPAAAERCRSPPGATTPGFLTPPDPLGGVHHRPAGYAVDIAVGEDAGPRCCHAELRDGEEGPDDPAAVGVPPGIAARGEEYRSGGGGLGTGHRGDGGGLWARALPVGSIGRASMLRQGACQLFPSPGRGGVCRHLACDSESSV